MEAEAPPDPGSTVAGPACIVDLEDEGRTYRTLRQIAVGLDPEGVVVHGPTGRVYVACSRSNAVAVIDAGSTAVDRMITVGQEPIDIVVDDRTGRVFVADARSDQLSVIDTATDTVAATVSVGSYPSGLCLDPARRHLYCGDAAGSTMSVVDVDRLERIAVVDAELGAGAIAAHLAGNRVYCVNFVASSVTVVDADSLEVVARVPLEAGPCAAGVHPDTGDLFVADSLASTVTRIDGQTAGRSAQMPVPNAPVGLTMGSAGDRLYVGNRGDGSVSVLGLDGVEWARIPVGAAPGGVTEHPDVPGRILVANAGSGTITVVDDLTTGPPATPVIAAANPAVGRPMPDLVLPDLWTQELRHLGEWAERKYVVNVFASW